MYQAYWGLVRSPFSPAAARSALASSPVHGEALARLDFLSESHSPLGLLLGPSGSGKSALLAEFAERAGRAGALAAHLATASADELHVLPALAEALHVAVTGEPAALWRCVVDRLQELRFDGLAAVILLDDLDRSAAGTLSLVERLLALPSVPLTIVAAARLETVGRLGRRIVEQAALRIELSAWSEDESREHLQRSLAAAGRAQPAFEQAAARRLFELSGGMPRKVNQLAQLALLAGAGQQLPIVDVPTIDAVHQELSASGS
jgi:type II secretory pathway predicted ATPase ExeA